MKTPTTQRHGLCNTVSVEAVTVAKGENENCLTWIQLLPLSMLTKRNPDVRDSTSTTGRKLGSGAKQGVRGSNCP